MKTYSQLPNTCQLTQTTRDENRLIILENEHLQVHILPDKSAEIRQVVYKPVQKGLLLEHESPSRPRFPLSDYDPVNAFIDTYTGGWQVLFPSGGSACEVNGASIPTHGEAFLLPAHVQIEENNSKRIILSFLIKGSCFPYELKRTFIIERNRPVLTLRETLTNTGSDSFPYMWGHHPAFGAALLEDQCRLDAPQSTVMVHQGDVNPANRLFPGSKGKWPMMSERHGEPVDLRIIPPESSPCADMFYLTELQTGWCALTNRDLGFGAALLWDVEQFPHLWVWQELNGSQTLPWSGKTRAIGLEPFSAFSTDETGLAAIIKKNQHRMIQPGERVTTELKLIVYQSGEYEGVESISPTGEIRFY